jgi:hypothetical protein
VNWNSAIAATPILSVCRDCETNCLSFIEAPW